MTSVDIILQVASSGSSGSSVSVELDSGPYNLRKLNNNYILEVIRWVVVYIVVVLQSSVLYVFWGVFQASWAEGKGGG